MDKETFSKLVTEVIKDREVSTFKLPTALCHMHLMLLPNSRAVAPMTVIFTEVWPCNCEEEYSLTT